MSIEVALIAMSAKPFHKGHHGLIMKAVAECDVVYVFTSLTDRDGFDGSKMQAVWDEHIIPNLPESVVVQIVDNPFQSLHEKLLHKFEGANYNIFCGSDDAPKYEGLKANIRFFGRQAFYDISGTRVRQILRNGKFSDFIDVMPDFIDCSTVWQHFKSS